MIATESQANGSQSLFADDLQVSHNPIDSLTTPSAAISPGNQAISWSVWMAEKLVVVRRKSRREVVPEGQMGLGL